MDIFGLALSPGYTALLWLGAILIVIGFIVIVVHPHRMVKMFAGIIAIIGVLFIAFALVGSAVVAPSTQSVAPTPSAQITNIGGLVGMTVVNSTSNVYQVAATTNTTAFVAPVSGKVSFHFDLMRTDTLTTAAVFGVQLNNPSIYNSTKATSYTYIAQYTSNKTNEITIDSTVGGQALVSVPSASEVQVNVTFTLNLAAFNTAPLYSTQPLTLEVTENGVSIAAITINLVEAAR